MKRETARIVVIVVTLATMGIILGWAFVDIEKKNEERHEGEVAAGVRHIEGCKVQKITVDGQDYIVVTSINDAGCAICPVPPKSKK